MRETNFNLLYFVEVKFIMMQMGLSLRELFSSANQNYTVCFFISNMPK